MPDTQRISHIQMTISDLQRLLLLARTEVEQWAVRAEISRQRVLLSEAMNSEEII